jgi:hypothetical protein
MTREIDSAIDRIVGQGHQVRPFIVEERPWCEIDELLIASRQELLELGQGVYSVAELLELVLLRRRESWTSR